MAEIVVMTAEQLRELVLGAVLDALREAKSGDLVSAKASGLSVRTFRRLVREGVLDGRKVGRSFLVSRRSLDAYLAERDAPKAKPAPSTTDDPIAKALAAGKLRVINK